MFLDLFIALLSGLQLWLAPTSVAPVAVVTPVVRPAAARVAPLRVAQAAPSRSARPADRASAKLSAALAQRRSAVAGKIRLAAAHQKQILEVDRLKKRRASWRRDRQLKKALADSQQAARRLSTVARRLREMDRRLVQLRGELERTAKAELRAGASTSRGKRLRGWVRSSRRALRRQRRIVLPDDSIDPLADPEDLEYQAQRISQSEQELEREIRGMVAREKRYAKMARLRRKATRAAELSHLDDDRPRRSTGRVGSGNRGQPGMGESFDDTADTAGDPAAPPDSDGDPGAGLSGAESDPVVVLADVVDNGTLNALRRAENSGDPRVKAAATLRARKQVQRQLERLRRARAKIQLRVRSLRRR